MCAEIITLRDGLSAPATVSAGITGVVLATGRDERFSGLDKALIPVAGRALIKRVLEQLVVQVSQIMIVAGRNVPLYSAYGCKVIADPDPEGRDPLPAMGAALGAIDTSHALFVPADAARLPPHLGAHLWQAHTKRGEAPCFARAAHSAIAQCCLIAKPEHASAEQAIAADHTLAQWLASRQAVQVDFTDWPAEFWGIASAQDVPALEAALRR